MAIAYWQNDNFVIFLSPENQSLASKVGGIKSPDTPAAPVISVCSASFLNRVLLQAFVVSRR